MLRGVMTCPQAQQILTQRDCDAAIATIVKEYDYEFERTQAMLVSWRHLPKGCSVSKGKAYFNTDSTQLALGSSAVGDSLSFYAVCAPASYEEFSRAKFCKGATLYNGGGPKGQGRFKDLVSCRQECDQDPRCRFFLWKQEKGTWWSHHCATFTQCDTPEVYSYGKHAVVFKKVNTLVPAKQVRLNVGQGVAVAAGVAEENNRDEESHSFGSALRFRRDSDAPVGLGGVPVPVLAPVPAIWFACQLDGGNERMVWTAKNLLILTKTVRKKGAKGLFASKTSFYTGKWAIEGATVVLTWDKLPPLRIKTVDGGQSFFTFSAAMPQRYSCTRPPSELTKLIRVGIGQAQKALDGVAPVGFAGAGAAPALAPVRKVWFACQLDGGNERMVWTAKNLLILTKTVRQKQAKGLFASKTFFYTGEWAIEGANVVLTWNKLPPVRINTVDGGQSFHSVSAARPQRYTCSKPPSALTSLLGAGIRAAQKALAVAQRTKAGIPTDFVDHGCLDFAILPVNMFVLSRGMTLEKCFAHCAKTKGMHYFAVTHGDRCFCSETSPGTAASTDNCDLKCTGNIQAFCGGFSTYASVYTMIDCLPPGPKEVKQDMAARSARLRGLYSKRKSESCGRAKGNEVEVDGSRIMVGTPKRCEEVCLSGRGAGKCHGFTFNALKSMCTFHMDILWGKPDKNPHFSCYFKKSVPL